MGQVNNDIAAAEADAEIELSVDDLVSLAAPNETKTVALALQKAAAMPLEIPTAIHNPVSANNVDTSNAGRAISRNSIFVVGLVIVVIVSGIAVYTHTHSRPAKAVQQAWKPAFPQPTRDADIAEPPEPQPQAGPVRYANPFDSSEVFEFPAGTSRAAAREAVAEILLQRAVERQPSARK
jgi:hypothetical protein